MPPAQYRYSMLRSWAGLAACYDRLPIRLAQTPSRVLSLFFSQHFGLEYRFIASGIPDAPINGVEPSSYVAIGVPLRADLIIEQPGRKYGSGCHALYAIVLKALHFNHQSH